MAGDVLVYKDYKFAISGNLKEIDLYKRFRGSGFVLIKKLVNMKLPENLTWKKINDILVNRGEEEKSGLVKILYDSYVNNE